MFVHKKTHGKVMLEYCINHLHEIAYTEWSQDWVKNAACVVPSTKHLLPNPFIYLLIRIMGVIIRD
jgi:hypothetical protein